MNFKIRMGEPEMEKFWLALQEANANGTLKGKDKILFKKLVKTFLFLESNPRHNSLNSHVIDPLSRRFGGKVWQSYIENNVPAAGRIYWVYGPDQQEITIVGIEPHPEDKKKAGYDKVTLSGMPS